MICHNYLVTVITQKYRHTQKSATITNWKKVVCVWSGRCLPWFVWECVLFKEVINFWRHWESNPDCRLGFWHWKTTSDQRTIAPTDYPAKLQFNSARLRSLLLTSPAKWNTWHTLHHLISMTAFYYTLDFPRKRTYQINTQRNLRVPWQVLTLHLTVAAPEGSNGTKVTQHRQPGRECAIPSCSTPPLSR